MLSGHLDILLSERPPQVFCLVLVKLLVFLLLICKVSLYILVMTPFLNTSPSLHLAFSLTYCFLSDPPQSFLCL